MSLGPVIPFPATPRPPDPSHPPNHRQGPLLAARHGAPRGALEFLGMPGQDDQDPQDPQDAPMSWSSWWSWQSWPRRPARPWSCVPPVQSTWSRPSARAARRPVPEDPSARPRRSVGLRRRESTGIDENRQESLPGVPKGRSGHWLCSACVGRRSMQAPGWAVLVEGLVVPKERQAQDWARAAGPSAIQPSISNDSRRFPSTLVDGVRWVAQRRLPHLLSRGSVRQVVARGLNAGRHYAIIGAPP